MKIRIDLDLPGPNESFEEQAIYGMETALRRVRELIATTRTQFGVAEFVDFVDPDDRHLKGTVSLTREASDIQPPEPPAG